MVNFGQVTSLLSAVNPFSWLKTLYIWLGIAAVFFFLGFFSGCSYKQTQWDAEKFRSMEKTLKLESKDKVAGAETTKNLEQDKVQVGAATTFVQEALKTLKPLIIVKNCIATDKIEVHTQPGTKQDETRPSVFLSPKSLSVYDVSVKPEDSGIRERSYEEAGGTEFNEGFEKVVIPNNLKHAVCRLQLTRLIDRIRQKQKIFGQE